MKGVIAKIIIGIVVGVLFGCQNPANRESNPIKKYNGLNFDVTPGKQTAAENDGPQTFCGRVFSLSIKDAGGKDAGRSLRFIVNESKTYQVHIDTEYNPILSLAGAPAGLDLKKKSDTDFELTWKPTARQGNLAQNFKLTAQVDANQCTNGVVYENLKVTVNVNGQQPNISLRGLDSFKTFGPGETITFAVTILDPSLTPGGPMPDLTIKSFDKNPTGEVTFLNASKAFACGKPQSLGSTSQSVVYNCTLSVTKLLSDNPNHNVGLTAIEISTKSTSGEPSVPVTREIKIAVPKTTVPPQSSNSNSKTGANV